MYFFGYKKHAGGFRNKIGLHSFFYLDQFGYKKHERASSCDTIKKQTNQTQTEV
jgi:hypothetical protein